MAHLNVAFPPESCLNGTLQVLRRKTSLLVSLVGLSLAACGQTADTAPAGLNYASSQAALNPTVDAPAWSARLGSTGADQLNALALDSTGNVVTGGLAAANVDGQTNAGLGDGLLTKYSSAGTKQWTRLAGTSAADAVNGVAIGTGDSIFVAGYLKGALDGQPNLGGQDLWLSRYDQTGNRVWSRTTGSTTNDIANAVAAQSGTVCIAGVTGKSLPGSVAAGRTDIAVACYTESGTLIWQKSFGTALDELANGIAVDASGNTYVVGTTNGALSGITALGGKDVFLAKLGPTGTLLWTKLLGTSADDTGTGVTLGPDGDLYLSAITAGALGGPLVGATDAVIARFDVNGTQLWIKQLGSAAIDEGLGIGADSAAVYLTGRSLGQLPGANAGGTLNLFAAKYALDGTIQTVREFSGGNNSGNTASFAVAAANGRLVVGGLTTAGVFDGLSGVGNADGILLSLCSGHNFTCEYAGSCSTGHGGCTASQACTPDVTGYVQCGCSNGTTGSVVCSDVNECLVGNGGCGPTTCTNTAGGRTCGACPSGYTGGGAAACVDEDECANDNGGCALSCINTVGSFHCGCSAGYTGDGITCTDIDECGVNNGGCDPLTLCSNTTGSFSCGACPAGYTGTGALGCIDANECGVDNGGCGYLSCTNTPGSRTCGCPTGLIDNGSACAPPAPAWSARVGSTALDQINAFALDSAGNVLVGGFAGANLDGQTSAGGQDGFLTRYSASGSKQWTRLAGTSAVDAINGVAIGSGDSIFVAGHLRGALDGQPNLGGTDLWLSRYDATGARLWTRTTGSTTNDIANAVTAQGGGVYVAGLTGKSLPGSTAVGRNDLAVARYDEAGTLTWQKSFGSTLDDQANGVVVDAAGNVYLAGSTSGALPGNAALGGKDLLLAKLDSSGAVVWIRQFGTALDDSGTGVTIGADGGLYVSGITAGALGGPLAGNTDAVLAKFDANGTQLWIQQLGSAALDEGLGIASDNSAVYLTGRSLGQLPGSNAAGVLNLFAARYGLDGTLQTVREYSGGNSSGSTSSFAVAAASGRLVFGGSTTATVFDGKSGFGNADGVFLSVCTGHNFSCELVGSCATNRGGCTASQTCTPESAGTVLCACGPGYTGSTVCSEVNECLVANGGCDALTTCTNTVGARTCSACPAGYTGTGATGCLPPAPTALTYATNPAVYTKDQAIAANTPSISGGAVVSWTIAPELPTGLSFNATTGVISGTPTASSAATAYTVTATNAGGAATVTLTLTVSDLAPPASLSYSTNPAVYEIGWAITPNTPSNAGGAATSYSVTPALPDGLSLNSATGAITGTPTTNTAAANYTVTASNTAGSTSTSVSITVRPAICTGTMVFGGGVPAVAMNLNPTAVVVADLNGDGKPDLATTNYVFGVLGTRDTNAVGVRLSNGDGTYGARADYNTGANPVAMTAADLNGDGKLDLAVASKDTWTVSVLLNNGNGTFAATVQYSTGSSPIAVTTADVNGDGAPDLIAANSGSNTVSVFLNNGNGTFATKVDYATSLKPSSVTAADVNGDGKPDLAVANNTSSTVSVLLNNGSGTFAARVDYTTGDQPSSITAADLNGDGKPDLAVANATSGTVSVLRNNGNGTFATKVDYSTTASPSSVTTSDFNGDGKLDLVVGGSKASVLLNNGNGTFATQATYFTDSNTVSVNVGDLNGDGAPDVAAAISSTNSVRVLLNNGDGTLGTGPVQSAASSAASKMATGDLNGDGKPDLVTVNTSSNSVSVLLSNGDGTFAARVDYATNSNPQLVITGDLNGDGRLDLAVAGPGNMISVFRNNGDGTFAAKADYATDSTPRAVATGDLNGDGKLDLVSANYAGDSVSVLLNNGDGTFAPKVDYDTDVNPIALELLDLNSDGKLDLTIATTYRDKVSLLINNGDGTFTRAVSLTLGTIPMGLAAGDLNGDGRRDLIVPQISLNTVAVWLNNGNGTFSGGGAYRLSGAPTSVAVGDLNGDGAVELAVVMGNTNAIAVLQGSGNGLFPTRSDYLAGSVPQAVVAVDLNGDGKLDLATTNPSTSTVNVLLQGACLP